MLTKSNSTVQLKSDKTGLLYAIPVTKSSFMDAYTLNKFWVPRVWTRWRYRWTTFRESIYTIQSGYGPNRAISCRLPVEIILVIEDHLKQLAFEVGQQEQKSQRGSLQTSAVRHVEACFRHMERHKIHGGLIDKFDRDLVREWVLFRA
jgi:hypothetical protein